MDYRQIDTRRLLILRGNHETQIALLCGKPFMDRVASIKMCRKLDSICKELRSRERINGPREAVDEAGSV